MTTGQYWGPGNVPLLPFSSLKGTWHLYFSHSWQAQSRPETLGLRLLHKAEPGLAVVKKKLKESWGFPWTVQEKSHTRAGFIIRHQGCGCWIISWIMWTVCLGTPTLFCVRQAWDLYPQLAASIWEEEK